jgi:glycosyltransferase involved in cell wall biosynthesis
MSRTNTQKKSLLWFAWKDLAHPQSGGAEVVGTQLRERLARDGWEVTLLTARYPDSKSEEIVNGVKIIRVGKNKFSHYAAAIGYYCQNLKDKFDFIVEEVNTIPYLINFFKGKEKIILFYHQLAREIWFYQMFFPLNLIGFCLEPIYTWVQSRFKTKVITVSNSSKLDLQKFGFKSNNISIISEGVTNKPLEKIENSLPKETKFTVLFHGSLRAMKRPMDALLAFEVFFKKYPDTQMWFSGSGDLGPKMEEYVKNSDYLGGKPKIPLLRGGREADGVELGSQINSPITLFGRTTDSQKLKLMQKAHVLVATSLKEGWGLIVSESNSMATPAIGYDVDGLRDSIKLGGGLVCEPNPQALSQKIEEMYLLWINESTKYLDIRQKCLESSKELTFEKSYQSFKNNLN